MSPLGPLACFALSLVILCGLLLPATHRWFLDHPNPRSLHQSPVPANRRRGYCHRLFARQQCHRLPSAGSADDRCSWGWLRCRRGTTAKGLPAGVRLIATWLRLRLS